MARQKNQCLFIQTWQCRRPSNSTTGFRRHSTPPPPPPIFFFPFFRLFFLVCHALSSAGNKCVSSGEDGTLGDASLAWIYPFLLRHCMRSAECFGQTVSSELSRKKTRKLGSCVTVIEFFSTAWVITWYCFCFFFFLHVLTGSHTIVVCVFACRRINKFNSFKCTLGNPCGPLAFTAITHLSFSTWRGPCEANKSFLHQNFSRQTFLWH